MRDREALSEVDEVETEVNEYEDWRGMRCRESAMMARVKRM